FLTRETRGRGTRITYALVPTDHVQGVHDGHIPPVILSHWFPATATRIPLTGHRPHATHISPGHECGYTAPRLGPGTEPQRCPAPRERSGGQEAGRAYQRTASP